MLDHTFPAANAAINDLVELGVFNLISQGKRHRVFEARDIVEELDRKRS